MLVFQYLLLALVSVCLGSFIGVLVYRLPRGLGFIKGRSVCDGCKKPLFWYLNIPILSYLLLKGRSSCCGRKINFIYPVIEIISVAGAFLLYSKFSLAQFAVFYLLFLTSITIFAIDLKHKIIPDELVWFAFFLWFLASPNGLFVSLFSSFLAGITLLSLNFLTKGKGMGLGDVKLALGLGGWFNLTGVMTWLFWSFLTGGIIATILLLIGKAKLKQQIAFGPFLIFAFWLIVL